MLQGNIILSEICEVVDCEHKTAPTQAEGYPLIRTPNIGRGVLKLENVRRINQDTYRKWTKRAVPKPNDLIMAREAPVGNVAIVPDDEIVCLGQRTVLIRVKSNEVEPKYLNYLFSSDGMHSYLNVLSNGATVGHLNVTDIRNLKLPTFPTKSNQKKIAAILSAYDDLIENNKRRIALLEKIAEEIYREWFVRFRFPGYQTAEFEKGIPKGWGMVKVEEAFDYLGGGTPSKDNGAFWSDGTVNWYTPSDITGAKGLYLTESGDKPNDEGIARSSAKLFPAYSIMMTSRATIGAIGINRTTACTNQGFITCIPNQQYPLVYMYHWLKLSRDYFLSLCGGATFPELNKSTFKRIEILTPTQDIVDLFRTGVNPIFEQIESLLCINENMKITKESLLPRLISGKLFVEDLDIQFPPSMQEDHAA